MDIIEFKVEKIEYIPLPRLPNFVIHMNIDSSFLFAFAVADLFPFILLTTRPPTTQGNN